MSPRLPFHGNAAIWTPTFHLVHLRVWIRDSWKLPEFSRIRIDLFVWNGRGSPVGKDGSEAT